jgi:glycogen operon protein
MAAEAEQPMRRPGPLLRDGGVDVSVASRHATEVRVCLFDDAGRETERIALDRVGAERFAGFIAGVGAGQRYGLRADGPWDRDAGHRFDPAKLLLDPYATRLDRAFAYDPRLAVRGHDTAGLVPKAMLEAAVAPVAPLPPGPLGLVYEVSTRAFTRRHPDVAPETRGTVAALAEPAVLDHLTALGVGTVELLPLAAAIDERHLGPLGLTNAWGYNPVSFFAPDPRLAPGGMAEIAATVAVLHRRGIRVVLDVVFNHTGESDELGPTLSLRGLDQARYFRLADHGRLVNDTGCGNTLALDRPETVALVMDALRHWAATGVDGFRYDLATVLGRRAGGFEAEAPLLVAIAQDPQLRDLVHLAEPWDVGPGGYRLGSFPAPFGEWNDRFRDDVRLFWRGDAGRLPALATRLAGSADIFAGSGRPPSASVNFVAAHDGFTLADTVAYAEKHNEANGEDNRDGSNENFSWNNGVEGPSDDPAVRAARARDVRALVATLMLARGTPMLTAGDEFGRSQRGNNNAYAQDNDLTWLDWQGRDRDLAAFVAALARARTAHPALTADRWLAGAGAPPDAVWLSETGPMTTADWSDPERRLIGLELHDPGPRRGGDGAGGPDHLLAVFNGGPAARLVLPEATVTGAWTLELASTDGAGIGGGDVAVPARSVLLLVDRPAPVAADPTERAAARRGVPDATTVALAAAHGVAADWWDISGQRHAVPIASLRAILAGLGAPVDTAADAAATRDRLARRRARPLPATAVVAGNAPRLTLTLPRRRQPARLDLGLDIGGERLDLPVTVAALERIGEIDVEGERHDTFAVPLPAGRLVPGRHRVRLGDAETTILVHPGAGFVPADLAAGGKGYGLAGHLYAMSDRRRSGIGDFETLARLGETAGRLGARLVGVNPLHHLFPVTRDRASPYQPSDRRFVDPIYLDAAAAAAEFGAPAGRDAAPTTLEFGAPVAALVDYPAVWAAKDRALRDVFATVSANATLRAEIAAFAAAGGDALADHAVFEVIAARHGGTDRALWSAGLAGRDPAALAAFRAAERAEIDYRLFLQWLADRQLAAAARRLRAAGCDIGVYRDLAVGTASDGGETWADPAAFVAGVSIGAPPDPFSLDGQVWCLPPMNPLTLMERGLAPWSAVVAANMRHAGALRVDHILGFARLYFVPDGASGRDGAYVAMPRDALIAATALASIEARCLVIGEDLGTAEPGLTPALRSARILASRVLWFDRDGRGFLDPARHDHMTAASLTTHDLPTFAGWRAGRDIAIDLELGRGSRSPEERRAVRAEECAALAAAAGLPSLDGPEAVVGVHRFLAGSGAALVLAQVEDLVGVAEPLNVPGTSDEWPNWRRRVTVPVEDIADAPIATAVAETLRRR